MGQGPGSFSPAPGLALFDYNQDEWIDIYLTNTKGKANYLYRNNGDGTFTNVADQAGVKDVDGNGGGVAAADFNNDGWPDLYVGNQGTIGDDLDYRSGGEQGNINQLFLNVEGPEGERVFENVTDVAGVGDPRTATTVGVADVNGDGLLDMYVGNFTDPDFGGFWNVDPEQEMNFRNHHRNVLYLNEGIDENGVPVFQNVTEAAGVGGPEQKNRNLEGKPLDLFDPDLKDAEGNPVGEKPGEETHTVLFTEVTGDGRIDLLTGDDAGVLTLYRNDGDTTGDGIPNFTDISRAVGINQVGAWMGLASADISLETAARMLRRPDPPSCSAQER